MSVKQIAEVRQSAHVTEGVGAGGAGKVVVTLIDGSDCRGMPPAWNGPSMIDRGPGSPTRSTPPGPIVRPTSFELVIFRHRYGGGRSMGLRSSDARHPPAAQGLDVPPLAALVKRYDHLSRPARAVIGAERELGADRRPRSNGGIERASGFE
jgi:hypothetical protein